MNELTRITIAEAKARLIREEPLVFVDTRNTKAWKQAEDKLPHAVRVPAGDAKHYLGRFLVLWNVFWGRAQPTANDAALFALERA